MRSQLGNQYNLAVYMRMGFKAFSLFICLQEQLFFFNKVEGPILLLASPVQTLRPSRLVKESGGRWGYLISRWHVM